VLTHTERSLLGRNHRKINKEQQNSTTEEQGQHQATGSGAGRISQGSTSEPEEVMMIKET
jgi:hypothetical protein